MLVAGVISRKHIDDVVLHTNFPDRKLQSFLKNNNINRTNASFEDIKKIYKYYLKEGHIKYELHPFLEKRLIKHFEELQKGIKHSPNYIWEQTGGLPGIHAEVLSVNEMLHKIEKSMKTKDLIMSEDIFKEMIGFNKNLTQNAVMIRCGDCNFLTYDIPFIEKIIKQ